MIATGIILEVLDMIATGIIWYSPIIRIKQRITYCSSENLINHLCIREKKTSSKKIKLKTEGEI